MKYINLILKNFERGLAIFFTVMMVSLLMMQVVTRYILKISFNWTEELAIICFIMSVYTGACLAVTRRQHLRLTMLRDAVPEKAKLVMDIFGNLCFAVTMLVIGKGLYVVVSNLHKYNGIYVATEIPKYVVYGTVWILFYVMIIRLVQDSIKLVKEYKAKKQTPTDQKNIDE